LAAKGSRISIIIESKNIESLVAEKYVDRISHLLKSPLHSILGIADQLRRKTAKKRYDEYFRLLDHEINSLSSRISKLLRFSRIELERLEPEYEKVDLTKLIKDIKKEFEPLVAKRKLEFKTSIAEGVTIWADRNMIKAAIENILDNDLKYTIIGEISLYLSDAVNEAKLEIKDTGIGIPENEIDLIFKKKFRGSHPVVRQNDGQGIGLYQCKHFIELNQGKIFVKSAVEEGTEFTVILPKNLDKSKDK
jgi:signal transduction histidine kinase